MAGEHRRPGGPTTAGAEPDASDVRLVWSYNAQHNRGPEPQGSGPAAESALGRTSNPRMPPQPEDRAGPGATDPGRARMAEVVPWQGYMGTCDAHRWGPQAESRTDGGAGPEELGLGWQWSLRITLDRNAGPGRLIIFISTRPSLRKR